MQFLKLDIEKLAIKAFQCVKDDREDPITYSEVADDQLRQFYRTIAETLLNEIQEAYKKEWLEAGEYFSKHQPSGYNFSKEKLEAMSPFDLFCAASRAIRKHEEIEKRAIENLKTFQQDVLVFLRSLGLVAQSVGDAYTHTEKNERLRGFIVILENAVTQVRRAEINLMEGKWSEHPDIFAADYHVKRYRQENSKLQEDLESARTRLRKAEELMREKGLIEEDDDDIRF